MKKLTSWALCLFISISVPAAANNNDGGKHCTALLSARDEVSDIDLGAAAENLQSYVGSFSLAEKQDAQKKADELLRIRNKENLPDWAGAAKHTGLVVMWAAYLYGAQYGYEAAKEIPDSSFFFFLHEHYSNFFMGLGFVGFVQQGTCAVSTFCSANAKAFSRFVKRKYERVHTRIIEKLRQKFHNFTRDSFSESEKVKMTYFVITAIAFTYFNMGYEFFNSYGDGGIWGGISRGDLRTNIDYIDFATGQMSLVAYYFLQKSINERLDDLLIDAPPL